MREAILSTAKKNNSSSCSSGNRDLEEVGDYIPEGNKNRKEFWGEGEENVVDFNIGSLCVYVCVSVRFVCVCFCGLLIRC